MLRVLCLGLPLSFGARPLPQPQLVSSRVPYRAPLAVLALRGGALQASEPTDANLEHTGVAPTPLRRRAMYLSCIGIVALWMGCGTLFYSYHNGWPLAQSFFYAVDAGMSIGFCTEVAETTVSSRAFTIVFIILGASVVGGALALFVQDAVAGAASAGSAEYRRLLERDAFRRADTDQDGVLSYDEFGALVRSCGYELGEAEMLGLCRKFDASCDGIISYREFMRSFRGLQALLDTSSALYSRSLAVRAAARAWTAVRALAWGEHRIYAACAAWVALGVAWGVAKQWWDVITATHFAVSALATGALRRAAPRLHARPRAPRRRTPHPSGGQAGSLRRPSTRCRA